MAKQNKMMAKMTQTLQVPSFTGQKFVIQSFAAEELLTVLGIVGTAICLIADYKAQDTTGYDSF